MAELFERKQNKYISQSIHKRYNNIHHASKQRVNYKRKKYQQRQRKRLKKINVKQSRTNLYDNMVSNFDDFTSGTIDNHTDVESLYNNYYFPTDYLKATISIKKTNDTSSKTNMNLHTNPWPCMMAKLKYSWTSTTSNLIDSESNDINKLQNYGELQLWRHDRMLHSMPILSRIKVNEKNNLQMAVISCIHNRKSEFHSAIKSKYKYIQWDYSWKCQCIEGHDNGHIMNGQPNFFLSSTEITGKHIISQFTDHVFDNIPGLVLIMERYLNKFSYHKIKLEMDGKLCTRPTYTGIQITANAWTLKSSDIGDIGIGTELDIYDRSFGKFMVPWFCD